MKSATLQIWWEIIRTSLWPIPMLMLVLALVLMNVASILDDHVGSDTALQLWWLHSGSGDDARNLLSTLVTALITMASVMFSITMLVLSLAANQYGSRLIRTYMSDLRTQTSLGMFVLTVVYCLLVLRTVQKDMAPADVPHVSVTFGLLLAIASVLTLLLFLQVIARSMVADDVIRRVAHELEEGIRDLPPLDEGAGDVPRAMRDATDMGGAAMLRSSAEGYVQKVDYEELYQVACRHGLTIQLHCKAGAYMCMKGWLASVQPAETMDSGAAEEIQQAVRIGRHRTPTQDLEFPIRHLVDVALRALSPGINDPNTATVVIDHLRGALALLMDKRLHSTVRTDESGAVRLIGQDTNYGAIFDEAFNQIRQVGSGQPSVVIHLLAAIGRLAEHVRLPEQRDALLHHVKLVSEAGLGKAELARDREDIAQRRKAAEEKLHATIDRVVDGDELVTGSFAGDYTDRSPVGRGSSAYPRCQGSAGSSKSESK